MANEFDYLSIIADKDLVDPTYDVSGLRTTTPTDVRLLADVPEYSGLRYDPTQQSYISDLYDIYSGGLPTVPVAQAQDFTGGQTIDTGVGGGGPNLVDQLADVTPDTTVRDQLIDEGIQAAEDDKGDMMLEDTIMPPMLDPTGQMGMESFVDTTPDYSGAGTASPIAQNRGATEIGTIPPDTIGPQPVNIVEPDIGSEHPLNLMSAKTTPAIDMSGNPFDYEDPVTLTDPVPTGGRLALGRADVTTTPDYTYDPTDPPMLGERGLSMDDMSGALDAPYGVNPDTGIPYQTPRTIADQKAVLGVVTEEDAANPKGLLEKIGLGSLDPTKTAVMAAINKAVGAPVSLLVSALEALPGYEPTFTERTLEEELGVTEGGKIAGDPNTSAFAGLNAVSAFGDPVGAAKDRIDTRLETIENNPNISEEFKENTQTMIDEYNRVTNKLGDIDEDPTGDQQIAIETYADIDRKEGLEKLGETYTDIMQTRDAPTVDDTKPENLGLTGPTFSDLASMERGKSLHGDGAAQDTGPSLEEAGQAAEDAQREAIQDAARTGMTVNEAKQSVEMPEHLGDYGQGAPVDRAPPGSTATKGRTGHPSGGDAPGGSGGKIVCTMMNESYGFGSFRNKIWLRHSKDLAPEYQIGYHKIFLPLVRLSKTNKLLKKTLEHIAVHRTIDIRQEARGKKHLLGRIYRKILEPICYIVGKYAKR